MMEKNEKLEQLYLEWRQDLATWRVNREDAELDGDSNEVAYWMGRVHSMSRVVSDLNALINGRNDDGE